MRRLTILIFALTASCFCIALAQSSKPKVNDVHDFMRAKLEHSKKLLEGLTVNDLNLVAKNSQAISLLSEDTAWQVLQTPEYAQRSREFRRVADRLTAAAQNRISMAHAGIR